MPRTDPTETLKRARRGDAIASRDLENVVYERLRGLAAGYMHRERRGHTWQPTELVHEAYLDLVDETGVDWQDRTHFMSIAACTMRRILVQHARRRGAQQRGGDRRRVPLCDSVSLSTPDDPELDVLNLDEALTALAEIDERKARVVELRFFGGLTHEEVASVLGVALRTVERDWRSARAWLHRELAEGEER